MIVASSSVKVVMITELIARNFAYPKFASTRKSEIASIPNPSKVVTPYAIIGLGF